MDGAFGMMRNFVELLEGKAAAAALVVDEYCNGAIRRKALLSITARHGNLVRNFGTSELLFIRGVSTATLCHTVSGTVMVH